jgi:recombinational DNA repair protein (RecF pathway)
MRLRISDFRRKGHDLLSLETRTSTYDSCVPKAIDPEVADAAFLAVHFTPLEPYKGAGTPRLCRCEVCGNECRVTYSSVRQGKRGCKRCWTDLIATKTRIPREVVDAVFSAAKMIPLEPYFSANKPLRALCQVCGTEGRTTYATLTSGHGGCKPCGYEVVRRKLQDLKTDIEAIDKVYERAGLTVLEPWVNANVPRLSRCNKCGNESRVRYAGIYSGQGGCMPCGAAARGLAQRNPAEVVEAAFSEANLEPLEDYPGTDVRRKCRCLECGETVFTAYKDIAGVRKRSGCRFCAYRKMGDRKVLPTELVDALFVAKDLEPLEEYKGAAVPRLCRCMKCDREVSPQYNSLKSGQGGCKYCAPTGLQRAAPGILYLIKYDAYRVLKVGVSSTTSRQNRIKSHADNGWEVVKTWDVADAGLAEAVETAVLNHWRKVLGAPIAMRREDMPQGGYSETVAMLFVDQEEAIRIIDVCLAQICL